MPEPRAIAADSLGPAQRLEVVDLIALTVAVLLLIGSGLGMRDPWPADEPRFAAVARDMLASGDWLFPRVGGDLYQDKPPLYFWLLTGALALTGSIRWSFLLPSLIAACGITFLVYDLARRLAGRAAALCAAGLLICTMQFMLTARSAQIDATLCLLTTASLYALLRHLLLGPAWGWYFLGGIASGLGVITKGVGFLPLLVLLPYALLRMADFAALPRFKGGARWTLAGAGFLLGIAVWLVPMLATVAASGNAELAAYRNEILFQQTVERYASAWHHVKPWYFFLIEVIPPLWLPLSPLLFWLVPAWRQALRARDARVWLPLLWALITLVFFSLSPGKRGIYLLPALPAVVLAAAPYLPGLFSRRGVQRASLVLGALPVLAGLICVTAYVLHVPALVGAMARIGISSIAPIAIFTVAAGAAWLVVRRHGPLFAWPAALLSLALVGSYLIVPQINDRRSGHAFVESALAQAPPEVEVGLVAYKEQFLLYLDRPIVNFGHNRWREGPQETYDAARWLNGSPGRVLLVPQALVKPCFEASPKRIVGETSRETWLLVEPRAADTCARQGDPGRVIRYAVGKRTAPVGE